jgi:hypothetical protein
MNRSLLSAAVLLLALSGALLGQGAPFTLNSISPTQTTAGSPAFNMVLVVGNMPAGTVRVWFNGTAITPASVAGNQITAQIPSGLIQNSGTVNVIVSVQPASSGAVFSTALPFTINSTPVISTASPLPNATAGSAYSQTLAVTGGTAPYTWSVPQGGLQSGLTLSAAGVLSGTPTQGGTSSFTVSVADASGSIATKVFLLTVSVPPATLSVTGLTDVVSPAQQPTFDVRLSAPYPLTITGTITLTFKNNALYPADDPAIQFSNGGRALNFTIPAGQTSAFPTTLPSLQTGTVAGEIDLTLNYFAGGLNITPANPPVRFLTILRLPPVIKSVQVVKTGSGFNVLVTGYSTPRRVSQADFTFTAASGGNLQTSKLTVIVDSAFTNWYSGSSSPLYGSLFLYTQPFTVEGSVGDIGSVSVTLAHETGTSAPASASF